MELQLFGINHKTSEVSEREKFIINELNQEYLSKNLKKKFGYKLDAFFGLSTCNRTEMYLTGEKGIAKQILHESKLLLETEGIPDSSFYFLSNQDAMVHMAKVASGIDSQI
jgi:glutamyl-tRNA reductase